jgi:hypothetical protein
MQCTSTPCRKRFKGKPGDKCPKCGGNAKPNAHTNTKPWRQNMCGCNGLVYTPKETFTTHRKGSKGCIHEYGDVAMVDMPGTGEEYPF